MQLFGRFPHGLFGLFNVALLEFLNRLFERLGIHRVLQTLLFHFAFKAFGFPLNIAGFLHCALRCRPVLVGFVLKRIGEPVFLIRQFTGLFGNFLQPLHLSLTSRINQFWSAFREIVQVFGQFLLFLKQFVLFVNNVLLLLVSGLLVLFGPCRLAIVF